LGPAVGRWGGLQSLNLGFRRSGTGGQTSHLEMSIDRLVKDSFENAGVPEGVPIPVEIIHRFLGFAAWGRSGCG